MKAYVATTGVVFGLIVLAHIARIAAEGAQLLREPMWMAMTAAAAVLAIWAGYLLKPAQRSEQA
jgi:hypothetical protein